MGRHTLQHLKHTHTQLNPKMSSAYSDRIIIPNKHDYTYHDKKESKTYYFYNAMKIKIDLDTYQTLQHEGYGNDDGSDELNVKVGDVVAIQADADDDDDNGNEDKVDDFI